MKLKTDFITNSSSTSFIVWGTVIDREGLKEKIGDKVFELFKNDTYYKGETKEDFFDGDMFGESLEEYISKSGKLEMYNSYYSDEYTIGQSPPRMRDDQTLLEFKEQVSKMILDIGILVLPEDVSYHTICERDG